MSEENQESTLAILQTNPPPPPLPDGWVMHTSKSQPGYAYYFNQFTGERRWDLPIANLEGLADAIQSLTEQTQNESSTHVAESKKKSSPQKRPREEEKRSSSGAHEKKRSKPEQVRVLHILKKHNKSRRPSSWRAKKITISKEEAIEELNEMIEILNDVKGDPKELRATFEELAKTESDCTSAKRGGDVGFFGRKKMQPNFEKASFALHVGEMTSQIVETSSGVHIILRLG